MDAARDERESLFFFTHRETKVQPRSLSFFKDVRLIKYLFLLWFKNPLHKKHLNKISN